MTKNYLFNKLQEYGVEKYNDENYYLDIALDFTRKYIEFFDETKLTSLSDFNNFLNVSRLSSKNFSNQKNVEELFFDDTKIFYFEGKPCLEINLKMKLVSYWIDGTKQPFSVVCSLPEYIVSLNDKMKGCIMEEFHKFQDYLIFLNHFYNYVLFLLEELVVTKIDSARVGLFKNAYFDILNFNSINIDLLKR